MQNFKKDNDKHLDILINNAGVMDCPKSLTKDGFEMQIGVNHFWRHFLLTNLLIDILRSSTPSRIIILSSLVHGFGSINVVDLNSQNSYGRSRAYCQSKLANILFPRELAKRLNGSGVTVNALHPRIINTELFRNWRLFQTELGKYLTKPLIWPFIKSPKSGAQTSLYASLDPSLNHITGQYFSDCRPKDEKASKCAWAESEVDRA
ncbi:LOW QUALITY PROTEIN: retinol dehydrogenase 14-like [Drosophila guanche]|uniref:LOW QUALITY PROTEIN: retinol dehydrogenase 14-like n=1 Tax=Drosophila guanche TaxID=7266 RepID=UPI001470C3ED|nr:LOW QUALITY PROTEIN: retinol dehydrogenase 14-like [Drosophila guanche]